MNVLGKYSSDNNYLYVIQSDGYFKGTGGWGLVSGVAAASDHKAEAISLLSLIAEDEAFRMQLFYGKEGRAQASSSSGPNQRGYHAGRVPRGCRLLR